MEYKEKCLILDILFIIFFTFMWVIAGGIYIGCKEMGILNPMFDLFGQHKLDWMHYFILATSLFIYCVVVVYCMFFNKKIATYTISISVSLSIYFLVTIFVFCSYFSFTKFSTKSWQEDIRERSIMVKDLEKNYNIVGMPREKVERVLGKFDDKEGENEDYIYDYETGYVKIYFSQDIVDAIQIFDAKRQ